MPSLNKVILLGNLTRDPELRYTPQGTAVCAFGLAVNRRVTVASGEAHEETCFVDIDVWGPQAQSCSSYLHKGSPALVDGRLRMSQWEDRETGRRRTRLRVQAERVQFVGPPVAADFAAGASADGRDGSVQDDVSGGSVGSAVTAGERDQGSRGRSASSAAAQMPVFEPLPAEADDAAKDIPF